MTAERVQKILAQAGYGSRRGCEKLIEAGRVVVNGKKIKLGAKADPAKDEIRLDGQLIKTQLEKTYIAIYKPRGVLSSKTNEFNLTNITDLVPNGENLHLVGRLDLHSEGLVLLTNDGDLTNKLTHPRYEHEKEYRVLVARHPDQKQLEAWRRGIVLEDGFKTAPANVRIEKSKGKGAWLRVIMKEGHKRQIRETAKTLGLPVVTLIRVRIDTLHLESLKAKDWRNLTPEEISKLKGKPQKPKNQKRKRR